MHELDETTRRELKTIEFLKQKASEMAGEDLTKSRELSKKQQQAQLLLNLQSPRSMAKGYQELSGGAMDPLLDTPPYNQSALNHLNLSPTFQRLHSTEFAVGSPTASASPHADEESPAQSLLDHWVNTVSNTHLDINTGAMTWGDPPQAEFPGWSTATAGTSTDPRSMNGLVDGSDWSYWEALVNQIQRAP